MKTEAVLLAAILGVWGLSISAHADPWFGAGTAESPYLIYDANDMQAIGANPGDFDKHFKMMADIDLSYYDGQQGRPSFNIIGRFDDFEDPDNEPFTGSFDGNGHRIINCFAQSTIECTGGCGLFAYLGPGSAVKNLGLEDMDSLNYYGYVGTLAGCNEGTITNCYSTGSVVGGDSAGGLVGNNFGGTIVNCDSSVSVTAWWGNSLVGGLTGYNSGQITDCNATGSVEAGEAGLDVGGLAGCNTGLVADCYAGGSVTVGEDSERVGGVVGYNFEGMVSNCYATGSVTAGGWCEDIGGLVGLNSSGTISNCRAGGFIMAGVDSWGVGGLLGENNWSGMVSNCCASGSVSGEFSVGGLVGANGSEMMVSHGGSINNCYATGSVEGVFDAGGLVGTNYEGQINNCYATGDVQGNDYVGGFAGANLDAHIRASFWDTQSTAQEYGVGYNEGSGTVEVFGKTTAQMWDPNTFIDAGWDFVGETKNGPSDDWVEPNEPDYMVLWFQSDKSQLPGLPLFSGGSGTLADPYIIVESNELNTIGHNSRLMDKHFKLESDIDLGSVDFYMLAGTIPFTGVFDGNDYTISNFTWTSSVRDGIGLFGYLGQGGQIKNLSLEDPNIRSVDSDCVAAMVGFSGGMVVNCHATGLVTASGASRHIGSIVGFNATGTISYCSTTAAVTGDGRLGGLVGRSDWGMINDCYATGPVTTGSGASGQGKEDIGGLVGLSWYTIMSNCYATASVTAGDYSSYVGGLAGRNHGTVADCYATGNVQGGGHGNYVGGLVGWSEDGLITYCHGIADVGGNNYVGGLVGVVYNGSIDNSYATGNVEGNNLIGGLVGNDYNAQIDNCWATGSVEGDVDVAGLVGYNDQGTISNCYSTGRTEGNRGVGGLAGANDDGMVTSCYATGSVIGSQESRDLGGLVAINWYGTITNCYADCSVTGGSDSTRLGGLVGRNSFSSIGDCYTTGNVRGKDKIGGLAGINEEATISDCYATGNITAGDYPEQVGGFVGHSYYSTIFDSFWDTETTGQGDGVGQIDGSGTIEVFGKPTGQMQDPNTFMVAGWDFEGETENGTDDIWKFIRPYQDYPRLSWQPEIVGDFVGLYGVNMLDFAFFAQRWLDEDCASFDDCDGADLDVSGWVDIGDALILAEHWMEGL